MVADAFLYDRLRELTREHVSYSSRPMRLYFGEPSDANYHDFGLEILKTGRDGKGDYVLVLTEIICLRDKGEIGSPYQPLCCMSMARPDGVEFSSLGNSAVSGRCVAF
jgi:hypothetical protein